MRVTTNRKVCPNVTKRASRMVLRQTSVPSSNVLRVPVSLAQSAQAQPTLDPDDSSHRSASTAMCIYGPLIFVHMSMRPSLKSGSSEEYRGHEELSSMRCVVRQVILIAEIRQRHRSHLRHGTYAQVTFGARTDVCNEPARATISARATQKRT